MESISTLPEWIRQCYELYKLKYGSFSQINTSDRPLTVKELLRIGRFINNFVYREYRYAERAISIFGPSGIEFVNCIAISQIIHILWDELFKIRTMAAISKRHMFSVIMLSDHELICLDGQPKIVTLDSMGDIKNKEIYPWLLIGEQAEFYVGSTLIVLGSECRQDKRYSDAEGFYHSALSVFDKHPDIYFNLGNLLCEVGRFGEAIKMYKNSLDIYQDDEVRGALKIALSLSQVS